MSQTDSPRGPEIAPVTIEACQTPASIFESAIRLITACWPQPAGPQFKSFHYTQDPEARSLHQLLLLASDFFPRYRRILYAAINALRFESERTAESDRDRVLRALLEGCADFSEIVEETRLPAEDVRAILDWMMSPAVDLVEMREKGGKTDVARGARRILYFLRSVPAGSSSTTPSTSRKAFSSLNSSYMNSLGLHSKYKNSRKRD